MALPVPLEQMSPWLLLFAAAALLLGPARLKPAGAGLAAGAYAAAAAMGRFGAVAGVGAGLLLALGWASRRARGGWGLAASAAFVAMAILLMRHVWPGFANFPVRLAGSPPFPAFFLNLDKPLVGLVFAIVMWRRAHPAARGVLAGALGAAATGVVCLSIALCAGLIGWRPAWPRDGWLWALDNLLLVALAEEALFRGCIQHALAARLAAAYPGCGRWRQTGAIGVAALLFGCAHAAGGVQWVGFATLAGAGYGVAYRFGGLRAAVLAHFGVNLAHYALFTYPVLG